jgi:hypothetical protein
MSRKNRAFALAVATAALVGISAPVAHAAYGSSGFNNDIPVNAGLGVVQVPVDGVSGALGILSTGNISSTVTRNCAQTPTQTNTNTASTGNVNNG